MDTIAEIDRRIDFYSKILDRELDRQESSIDTMSILNGLYRQRNKLKAKEGNNDKL
jgi:hypothetical protein